MGRGRREGRPGHKALAGGSLGCSGVSTQVGGWGGSALCVDGGSCKGRWPIQPQPPSPFLSVKHVSQVFRPCTFQHGCHVPFYEQCTSNRSTTTPLLLLPHPAPPTFSSSQTHPRHHHPTRPPTRCKPSTFHTLHPQHLPTPFPHPPTLSPTPLLLCHSPAGQEGPRAWS
jgi:hypothetical protein